MSQPKPSTDAPQQQPLRIVKQALDQASETQDGLCEMLPEPQARWLLLPERLVTQSTQ